MEGILASLGGRASQRLLTGTAYAAAFWLGGILAWCARFGTGELQQRQAWFDAASAGVKALAIAGALTLLIGTGVAVSATGPPMLRLLEGYWPRWFSPLRRRLVSRSGERQTAINNRLDQLAPRVHTAVAGDAERTEYLRLDRQARRLPRKADDHMPTRAGNILRAAEARIYDKYGINAVAVWQHFYLVVPDAARGELATSRDAVDRSVAAVTYALLFLVFAPLAWWVTPVAIVVAAFSIAVSLRRSIAIYADLVEATVDLFRITLYEQVRWPLPANPSQEPGEGARLVSYLIYGSDADHPTFTPN